jgi:hypothetical protein
MIFGELLYGQGLGNQLWNVFAVQKFALDLDLDFAFFGSANFKANRFQDLRLPSAARYNKSKLHQLVESQTFHPDTGENITEYDPTFINKIRPNTLIRGYFQSVSYLPNKQIIEGQLRVPNEIFNGCTIVIRGGEYRNLKTVFLDKVYYSNAVDQVKSLAGKNTKFRIVTDDPRLAKSWFPNLEIISSGGVKRVPYLPYLHPIKRRVLRDFGAIQNSRFLILSNSSFAWWGAYSNSILDFSIAPKYWAAHNYSNGYWSQGDSLTPYWHFMNREGSLYSFEECEAELKQYREDKRNQKKS